MRPPVAAHYYHLLHWPLTREACSDGAVHIKPEALLPVRATSAKTRRLDEAEIERGRELDAAGRPLGHGSELRQRGRERRPCRVPFHAAALSDAPPGWASWARHAQTAESLQAAASR